MWKLALQLGARGVQGLVTLFCCVRESSSKRHVCSFDPSCTRSGDFVFFQELKACELTRDAKFAGIYRSPSFALSYYPYVCEEKAYKSCRGIPSFFISFFLTPCARSLFVIISCSPDADSHCVCKEKAYKHSVNRFVSFFLTKAAEAFPVFLTNTVQQNYKDFVNKTS